MSVHSKNTEAFSQEYLNWKKPYLNLTEEIVNKKLALRKKKLSEILATKRLDQSNHCTEILPYSYSFNENNNNNNTHYHLPSIDISHLDSYCSNIQSSNMSEIYLGLNSIRKLLCSLDKDIIAIQRLKETGTLLRIVDLITKLNSNPQFLTEIFWILTNVAASNQQFNEHLYQCNLITNVNSLIQTSSLNLNNEHLESIAWMLGNFSNEYHYIRKELNEKGVISFFIYQLTTRQDLKTSNKEKMFFFLFISLTDTQLSDYHDEKRLMKYSLRQLESQRNNEYLPDQMQTLIISIIKVISICSANNLNTFKYICKKEAIPLIIELLNHEGKIRKTVLKVLGDHAYQTIPLYSTTLIEHHILDAYSTLLKDNSVDLTIKKEIAWTLSNLSSECPESLDEFFLHEDIIEILFQTKCFSNPNSLLNNTLNKEVFWCISNLTKTTMESYIKLLVDKGYLSLVMYFIDQQQSDFRLPLIALEGLLNIINVTRRSKDEYCLRVINYVVNQGLMDKLYKMLMNNNKDLVKISEKAIQTINCLTKNGRMEL